MFSWLRKQEKKDPIVHVLQFVVDGLKKLYKSKLRPLEEHYLFNYNNNMYNTRLVSTGLLTNLLENDQLDQRTTANMVLCIKVCSFLASGIPGL